MSVKGVKLNPCNGSKLRVGIVVAKWNAHITEALLEKCKNGLHDAGVVKKKIVIQKVPGTFELPYGALRLIHDHKVDVAICLGAVIKGETTHAEYLSQAVSYGIMKVQLETGVPVVFGVLTCLSEAHALARSIGKKSLAYEWGLSAVEMGLYSIRFTQCGST